MRTFVLVFTIILANIGCSKNASTTSTTSATKTTVVTPTGKSQAEINAKKQEFESVLKKLPSPRGERWPQEAVDMVAPHVRSMFLFTIEDWPGDIYGILALVNQLSERPNVCKVAVEHFSEITHPQLKMVWACLLFQRDHRSPEIVQYLKISLKTPVSRKELSEALGRDFDGFARDVENSEVR